MSTTKTKFIIGMICLLSISSLSYSQATVELPATTFAPGSGPSTATVGPISYQADALATNVFLPIVLPANQLTMTAAFQNQVYTGLGYSNISTGLVFGASPTTATDPGGIFPTTQRVDPLDIYSILGNFPAYPGGPTDNMFTANPNSAPTVQSGTGIIADANNIILPGQDGNGAISVFTAAQVLFNLPGGPAVHNTGTRYYFGDVVITFNRFVNNPVIHLAGLGGSYRYISTADGLWKSCYFSTELEVPLSPTFSLTRMSGNQFFTVSGNNILNSSPTPNGASVSTIGLFDDIGAASGSFRVNGPIKTLRLRVYLRGSNASAFPWSTVAANIQGSTRNPFTGDIWWISASSEPSSLVTLPSTGVNLSAALNGNDVLLKWKTESEINSDHFEVERSTDGRNFTMIGTKSAAGNSATTINYSDVDPNMNASVYYYRLKLVDVDGRFAYSNIAMVRKGGDVKTVKMYPNPATSQVNLEFANAKGNYVISMYNQAGQEVITQKASITYGTQYVTVNRNALADGSYIIRVRNTETNEVLFTDKVVLH